MVESSTYGWNDLVLSPLSPLSPSPRGSPRRGGELARVPRAARRRQVGCDLAPPRVEREGGSRLEDGDPRPGLVDPRRPRRAGVDHDGERGRPEDVRRVRRPREREGPARPPPLREREPRAARKRRELLRLALARHRGRARLRPLRQLRNGLPGDRDGQEALGEEGPALPALAGSRLLPGPLRRPPHLTMDGFDLQYVVALDKRTGRKVWKSDRSFDFSETDGDLRKAYSTPLFIGAGDRIQMISSGSKATYAYDPRSGRELWKVLYDGFSNASRPVLRRRPRLRQHGVRQGGPVGGEAGRKRRCDGEPHRLEVRSGGPAESPPRSSTTASSSW